ncbi:hypothetical protein HHK36_024767 [Tetracentron sinense]|uniref:Uncharacterized protein n=1 Tax=Tetracentron sinense TaxID=13715 RepID=A0A835D709_TETSI|nr:hypothetical protein HHK36_024767 [Tetracentron sinense]
MKEQMEADKTVVGEFSDAKHVRGMLIPTVRHPHFQFFFGMPLTSMASDLLSRSTATSVCSTREWVVRFNDGGGDLRADGGNAEKEASPEWPCSRK